MRDVILKRFGLRSLLDNMICRLAVVALKQKKYPHTNMNPYVGNLFIYKWCDNCARQRMVLKAFWCLAGGRTQRRHVCTILLTLTWALNCIIAQAQQCAEGEYLRQKYKVVLRTEAPPWDYAKNSAGTYVENGPELVNGAIAYKIIDGRFDRFIWKIDPNKYVITPQIGENTMIYYTDTSDTDLALLRIWHVWASSRYGYVRMNVMKAFPDGVTCSQCPQDSLIEECAACGAGKYKNGTGAGPCIDCLANQYSTTVGATSNTCIECVNSQSPAGSGTLDSCICNAGSTGSDGAATCAPCAVGTFKTSSGPATCTGCGAGKFSAVTGSSSNVCACNAGSTGADGADECTLCATGTYKIYPGNDACENCSAGTYSTTSSAVTIEVCLSCPSNSDAAEASDSPEDCICNAGFSGVRGGLCTRCPVAKYRAAP